MSLTNPVVDRSALSFRGPDSRRPAAALYRGSFALVLIALVLTATGCEPEFEGTDKIDYLRSKYTVELTAFTVRDFVEPAAEPTEGEPADEGEAAAEGDGEEADAVNQPTIRQDGYLDLLVSTTAKEPLPGITVDFYLQGPDGAEKATHRAYVETTGVTYGNAAQIGVVWEGIPYEDGDALAAQVREPVPAGDHAEYREYDGV